MVKGKHYDRSFITILSVTFLTAFIEDQATNVGLQLRESIRVPHITVEDLLGWKKRNSRSYFSRWLYYTIEMLISVNLNTAVLSPNCWFREVYEEFWCYWQVWISSEIRFRAFLADLHQTAVVTLLKVSHASPTYNTSRFEVSNFGYLKSSSIVSWFKRSWWVILSWRSKRSL